MGTYGSPDQEDVERLMGLIKKLRRHAAVAGGDFGAMFKGIEIPTLPLAIQRLLAEINKDEPDIDKLATVISSATGIAAKVIQTVNSSYYSPRSPVTQIKQAVMFLGLNNIRSMAMAYAAMEAMPKSQGEMFDHDVFWSDSLLRAFLARSFAGVRFNKDQSEEAFTAALIADVALPVLLSVWADYYAPVVEAWSRRPQNLSRLEREHFGWDHAQAGAWIIQSWGFPDEMVVYVGAHNLALSDIEEMELDDTIVVPIAVAAMCSSVLRPEDERNRLMVQAALHTLEIAPDQFVQMMQDIKEGFTDILTLFGLTDRRAFDALDQIISLVPSVIEERCQERCV
jgi:HD-like signal output (HDOD) protein